MVTKIFVSLIFFVLTTKASSNTIYLSAGGTLYISKDDGRNWKTSRECKNSATIFVIGTKIYTAGRGAGSYFSPCPLATSEDGGRTWTNISKIPKYDMAQSLFVIDTRIYLGTNNGLLISEDEGQTWSNKTTADDLGRNDISSVYVVGRIVYAGTNGGGLAISKDGGTTWTIKSTFHGLGSAKVKCVFADGNKVYAGTSKGLSISIDGGQTWVNKDKRKGFGVDNYDTVLSVFVANDKIYATVKALLDDGYLLRSEDGGKTWANQSSNDGLCQSGGQSLFALDNEIYYGCKKEDMLSLSRDDGQTWITMTGAQADFIFVTS